MSYKYTGFSHAYSGFSLVELCITVALIFIISGLAVISINNVRAELLADKAMYQLVDQLRLGRESAVTHRRVVELHFPDSNEIRLVQRDIPDGETVLSDVRLSYNYEFILFDGIPDCPDMFGNSASVDFGGEDEVFFISDGTLVDSHGDPLNGTIFIGLEGQPETARAVTVLGATGRVQSYRWIGDTWEQ